MRSHQVSANGVNLHVLEYGGDGPPLLAVHGTGLVARVWGVMVPHLTPHFRVFALDRRGHGDSDKPEGGYELEENAGDYAAVIKHFGMENTVGLGHSSGGTSLGMAAVRFPTLFRRIAMVDPIIFARPDDPGLASIGAGASSMVERTRKRRGSWPSAQAMFESLGSKAPFGSWQPGALWDYVNGGTDSAKDGSVTLKCPPELEARMYGHASALDLFAEFSRIPVPVLIIRGGRTDRLPRENAERAARVIPNAELVEMPELTHFASMEDPEGISRLCVEFLRRP